MSRYEVECLKAEALARVMAREIHDDRTCPICAPARDEESDAHN